jgi:hypothetical protein
VALRGTVVLSCSAFLLLGLPFLAFGAKAGAPSATRMEQRHWADFVETNFPFFSSVLDARQMGKDWPNENLTPRGLILNLGHDCWACFDTELLRMSLIWEGKGITPASMAQGSYHRAGHKAPDGQEQLPKIIGLPWIATGIYPGWQRGEKISLVDVRDPCPDKREVGRGPLPEEIGRFKAIRLSENGLCLEYTINGASVREWVTASIPDGKSKQVERRFHLENVRERLWLLIGKRPAYSSLHVHLIPDSTEGKAVSQLIDENGLIQLKIEPSDRLDFTVLLNQSSLEAHEQKAPKNFSKRHWPKEVTTVGKLSDDKEAFILDDIPLPIDNPENRNVRLADIAFFRNGEAAAVSFDGDVWKNFRA